MHKDAIYCLRTFQQNLVQSIMIADRKAGILLGANFLVVSILMAEIAVRGANHLTTVTFLASLLIIMFALRALSPKYIKKKGLPTNLLYFETATHIDFQSYFRQMKEIIKEDEKVHELMLNDCYQLALVVRQKHKYLKQCFILCFSFCFIVFFVFLYGIWITT